MKPYFLSICAVVKNEFPYILEWLAFHKLQGVEHFYIYDNGSTDGTYELLEGISKKEWLTLYNWKTVIPVQLKAYQNCLDTHRKDSEWIAFLDVDEFLYSKTLPNLKEFIKSIIFFSSINVGGIAAHWYLFGSSGHKEKTDGLVIERFTHRQADINPHVKSIVRTDVTESTGKDPHTFYFNKGFFAANERGMGLPREYTFPTVREANNLRINHYHTKSHVEYLERKKLGDPQTLHVDTGAALEDRFKAHDHNEIKDTYLRDKYADFIKTMIEKELF